MEIPLLLVLPYMESARSYEEWVDVYSSINLSMVTLIMVCVHRYVVASHLQQTQKHFISSPEGTRENLKQVNESENMLHFPVYTSS